MTPGSLPHFPPRGFRFSWSPLTLRSLFFTRLSCPWIISLPSHLYSVYAWVHLRPFLCSAQPPPLPIHTWGYIHTHAHKLQTVYCVLLSVQLYTKCKRREVMWQQCGWVFEIKCPRWLSSIAKIENHSLQLIPVLPLKVYFFSHLGKYTIGSLNHISLYKLHESWISISCSLLPST